MGIYLRRRHVQEQREQVRVAARAGFPAAGDRDGVEQRLEGAIRAVAAHQPEQGAVQPRHAKGGGHGCDAAIGCLARRVTLPDRVADGLPARVADGRHADIAPATVGIRGDEQRGIQAEALAVAGHPA
jgi:hypothetical protein